ncbi:MAG: hypothetical protein A2Y25_10960 [Candidatus Melainabacteria bacterium GWF2_37_15]|nr:MAG: hypothetical protein A2Y25_10960 [Candidatus Melainabacteria bacterium GWF2_37_15]
MSVEFTPQTISNTVQPSQPIQQSTQGSVPMPQIQDQVSFGARIKKPEKIGTKILNLIKKLLPRSEDVDNMLKSQVQMFKP